MRISVGKSRKDINWRVEEYTWSELCDRLSETIRTPETINQYKSMTKDEKSQAKDVGGFVGGVVEGRRTKNNIQSRTLITLDADYASRNLWDTVAVFFDNAACCYSTHSHQPNAPRLRIVFPLDREVTPEEYEPIARRVAGWIGIDQFDVTTYETARLMFWPSTSSDGEFIFEYQDGDFICADDILDTYVDWHNTLEWPLGTTEDRVRLKQASAQGDPSGKPGAVGLFCRAYDIPSAIETFLPEVYIPCDTGDRYTYADGSTAAGVVIYDNGKFAYSHHATDPAGGVLCNAFDLVRLHKFSDLDYEMDKSTPVNLLPSYKAMTELVMDDPVSKQLSVSEKLAEAQTVFDEDVEEVSYDWASQLSFDKNDRVKPTTDNLVVIIDNDPNLAGKVAMNKFTGAWNVLGDLPWRKVRAGEDKMWADTDDSGLRYYIEKTYEISNANKVSDALNVVTMRHEFHPVCDYLNSLHWDGIKRGEYLFSHYMGAEDNLYTRTATRKWLTAAVARVMEPGIKFDNMVVLVGAQGIGKSYLGNKLGRQWFSDTFVTVQGKDAYDQLKGSWIIEMGELSAMKRAEVESIKLFISKQEDTYRAAYSRRTTSNKRQCVFYGTTNEDSFLRDATGNRRFWPIGCDVSKRVHDVFSLTSDDVDQIWAEAVHWYRQGESLFMPADIAALAALEQEKYMALDPRIGLVEKYLDRRLPKNWDNLDITARRNFIQGYTTLDDESEATIRTRISIPELAYELFGEESINSYQAKEYHGILTSIKGWSKSAPEDTPFGRQPVFKRTGQ